MNHHRPRRSSRSLATVRSDLADRLRARHAEIEEAVLARAYAIADPTDVKDPEYLHGLRDAVSTAIDYLIAVLECGDADALTIPDALLTQARLAGRNTVDVGTALRRCAAGCAVVDTFILDEAEQQARLSSADLKKLMDSQALLRDRLLAVVDDEHARGRQSRRLSSDTGLVKRLQRLLAGELIDTSDLFYGFDANHLGVIAEGDWAADVLRELASSVNSRCLVARPDDGTVWAWIGSRHDVDRQQIDRYLATSWPARTPLALGEPAKGPAGWRLTHEQAREAMPIARRGHHDVTRYADVALAASASKDSVLAASLRLLYLSPLARDRADGGTALHSTLRAYFSAGQNGKSAAQALRVSRQTVANHIRTVETRLGRPLLDCALELELALRLHDIDALSLAESRGQPK